MPSEVGRERREGRHAARGASRGRPPGQPTTSRSEPSNVLVDCKGEAASVGPRPRKHRRHEARSGGPVSEANGSQRDAVSRGRGPPSGRGLAEGVVDDSESNTTE